MTIKVELNPETEARVHSVKRILTFNDKDFARYRVRSCILAAFLLRRCEESRRPAWVRGK